VKLDIVLFNHIIDQVRHDGPEGDCRVDMPEKSMSAENDEFIALLRMFQALATIDVKGATATAFFIGFESGLQYAKVSQEVKQLNKLIQGEIQ
jgi:hypothetical protein